MKERIKYIILLLFAIGIAPALQAQSLPEYLSVAASNNPGLKAQFMLYQAALEKVPQVGALPDPEITFGYFISPVETRVGPQRMTISAKQMFPWMGTLGAKKSAATDAAKAQFEAFEAQRRKLNFKISKAYFSLYALNAKIDILSKNIAIMQSYERLALQRYEEGVGSMVNVLRVQLNIEEHETMKVLMEQKIPVMSANFNQMLNRPMETEVILPDSLEETALLWSEASMLDSILNHNPILESLAYKQSSMQHNAVVAKKAGAPSIGLGLNYVMISERTDMNPEDNGKDALMPMVMVKVPIHRKKYKAKVKEVNLKLEALKNMELEARNQIASAAVAALTDFRDAEQRLVLYKTQREKVNQMLQLLVESYAVSGKQFEEVLRLQQMLLKYENQKVEALRDLHIANAKIQSI